MSNAMGMLLTYKTTGNPEDKALDETKLYNILDTVSDIVKSSNLDLTINTYREKHFFVVIIEFTDDEYLLRSKKKIDGTFIRICKATMPYYATIAVLEYIELNSKFFDDLLEGRIPRYADTPESDKLDDRVIDINIAFLHRDFFKKEPNANLLQPIRIESVDDHYLITINEDDLVNCWAGECLRNQLRYLSSILK